MEKVLIPKLGRIEFIPIREVWPNEATSFTPWLLENEELLADLLKIELTIHKREQSVGSFSLDLIGENLANGSKVIIENQLEKTDHNHLGQLLTYAGGLEPTTIVWIASNFRDEHRAALDWLNRVTDENTHFFGIELKAIKIGDSEPAPWMEVVVEPNSWNEEVKKTTSNVMRSDVSNLYLEFWGGLVNRYKNEVTDFQEKEIPSRNYFMVRIGKANLFIGLVFAKTKLRVEIYFGDPDGSVNANRFEALYENRSNIENLFGDSLTWEDLEGRKACRISFYRDGVIKDTNAWREYQEWFKDNLLRIKKVTESQIFQNIINDI
jgi:hypothetical protein